MCYRLMTRDRGVELYQGKLALVAHFPSLTTTRDNHVVANHKEPAQ
jgi:hypothetical protein